MIGAAIELDKVTISTFSDLIGQVFEVQSAAEDGGAITLSLVEASRPDWAPAESTRPFSLQFLGPTEPALPQRIYPVTSEALGEMELFLVPIQNDADGRRYEAVFN